MKVTTLGSTLLAVVIAIAPVAGYGQIKIDLGELLKGGGASQPIHSVEPADSAAPTVRDTTPAVRDTAPANSGVGTINGGAIKINFSNITSGSRDDAIKLEGNMNLNGSSPISPEPAAPAAPQDIVNKPFSPDSLATIKKFAKASRPIIIVDHAVTSFNTLNALGFERIATFTFMEGDEEDIKYYGKNAKSGVITITTNPLPPAPPPPPPSLLRKKK